MNIEKYIAYSFDKSPYSQVFLFCDLIFGEWGDTQTLETLQTLMKCNI